MPHSLSAQVSYYSEYIQSHGDLEYVGVYSDEVLTGTNDSRSGFQQLLADCRSVQRMIKVSVIGNHEKIKHYLGVWLKVFGFEVTDTAPHFTIEGLKSDSNVITHSNQSELAAPIRSLVYDFGIYR